MTTLGALCAAVVAAGPAGQEPGKPGGLYVKLSGAVLQQQDSDLASVGGIPLNATLEFDSGFGVHGAVGYTWSGESPVSVSLELEYSFRTADHETLSAPPLFIPAAGTNESHSLTLNGLASVEIAGGFGLYGGAGIGVTRTLSDLVLDLGGGLMLPFPGDEDVTISWQVMGGVQYAIGRHIVVFGGVRYFDAGDVQFETFGSENKSISVEIGLRVYF